jgi:hypothetical protein
MLPPLGVPCDIDPDADGWRRLVKMCTWSEGPWGSSRPVVPGPSAWVDVLAGVTVGSLDR